MCPGSLSPREFGILAGVLRARFARWEQQLWGEKEFLGMIQYEIRELFQEGYSARQLQKLWYSMRGSGIFFEKGMQIISNLAQACGAHFQTRGALRASVDAAVGVQRLGDFLDKMGGNMWHKGDEKGTGKGGQGQGRPWHQGWTQGSGQSTAQSLTTLVNRMADEATANHIGAAFARMGLGSASSQTCGTTAAFPTRPASMFDAISSAFSGIVGNPQASAGPSQPAVVETKNPEVKNQEEKFVTKEQFNQILSEATAFKFMGDSMKEVVSRMDAVETNVSEIKSSNQSKNSKLDSLSARMAAPMAGPTLVTAPGGAVPVVAPPPHDL